MYALASGSSGNCLVFSKKSGAILVDAGLTFAELRRRLKWVDVPIGKIKGVLLTHAHPDHIKSAAVQLCLKNSVPLYILDQDEETWSRVRSEFGKGKKGALSLKRRKIIRTFSTGKKFDVGDFHVRAFPVPHDVACVGFTLYDGNRKKVAIAYDFAPPPDDEWWGLVHDLSNTDVLVVEANYDEGMIRRSKPYSSHVEKARTTHMPNHGTAKLVLDVAEANSMNGRHGKLRKVVLAHLSGTHNSRSVARSAVGGTIRRGYGSISIGVTHRKEEEKILEIRL